MGMLMIHWATADTTLLLRREQDTMTVSHYVQAQTCPGDYVLSDYQEINFYARRPSTYLGAEISYVVIASGQTTGADLIAEIEDMDAKMIIVDVSPQTGHQIVKLKDYGDFHTYLQDHFTLLDILPRGDQQLEIYLRTQAPSGKHGAPPR